MSRRQFVIAALLCVLLAACGSAFSHSRHPDPDGARTKSNSSEHVVREGEVAVRIAEQYGIDLDRLSELNPGRDLDHLQIGDRLVVRSESTEPADAAQDGAEASGSARPDKVAAMAEHEDRESSSDRQSPSAAATALSMLLKLGFVLALAYATIWALKLLSSRREVSPRVRRDLRIVDTVKLSSTSSLHVVDVKGKVLLIACSGGRIDLLREFEGGDEQPDNAPASRFAEYLARYSGASFQTSPAGRIAGLLRDCAAYLQGRRNRTPARDRRERNEP